MQLVRVMINILDDEELEDSGSSIYDLLASKFLHQAIIKKRTLNDCNIATIIIQ